MCPSARYSDIKSLYNDLKLGSIVNLRFNDSKRFTAVLPDRANVLSDTDVRIGCGTAKRPDGKRT